MIKLQDSTPSIYYEQSRDFQLLGRLFDVVLNSVKTNSELVSTIHKGDTVPDSLLELYALTLGLRLQTTRYTSAHLRAVCCVFPELMRTKGSIHAIMVLCNALLAAEGIAETIAITLVDHTVRIDIPSSYIYTALLEDILNYVLPAGIGYTLIRNVDIATPTDTALSLQQNVTHNSVAEGRATMQLFDYKAASKNAALKNKLFTSTANTIDLQPGLSVTSTLYCPGETDQEEST